MQTIIGSTGIIGTEIAKELPKYTDKIRLVSRNPKKVNKSDELFSANILNFNELKESIIGSEIVYVTVGFEYDLGVWRENWPKFIKNVISVCEEENCKLVFFDNVYMYDIESIGSMTESSNINPISEKGKVRAEVANLIINAINNNKLKALIARSADFYGPNILKQTSLLNETVFKPISIGKRANWLCSANYKHSFTYTVDAGKATAQLGNSDKAFGQVWHLPTAKNPPTGKEIIELIAEKFGTVSKIRVAPKLLIKIFGYFNKVMKESYEMLYQYDRDYIFDSSKYETEFGIKPTSYEEGIESVIKLDYRK